MAFSLRALFQRPSPRFVPPAVLADLILPRAVDIIRRDRRFDRVTVDAEVDGALAFYNLLGGRCEISPTDLRDLFDAKRYGEIDNLIIANADRAARGEC